MNTTQDNKSTSSNSEPRTQNSGSPKYWLSLDQWREDPEFEKLAQNEFMSSPLADQSSKEGGWARREFLKLMGASMALTTFGCVRKAQKIVPYAKRPDEIVQGIANHYASTFNDGGDVFGVVVTTREGRPIKVEGNPEHPSNQGGMSARAHAHILKLYDPDRANGPIQLLLNNKRTNFDAVSVPWEKVDKALVEQLKKGKVALLTSTLTSPSTSALVSEFKKATGADQYLWDGTDLSMNRRAAKMAYGSSEIPRYRVDKAKYILSIGTDFLGSYLTPTQFTRDFSKGRNPHSGEMNRLVVLEGGLSLTGANADDRYQVRPSEMLGVVASLIGSLASKGRSKYAKDSKVKAFVAKHAKSSTTLDAEKIAQLADELWAHKGESLVFAGGLECQGPAAETLMLAANLLNSMLENDGKTIDYKHPLSGFEGGLSDLRSLIEVAKAEKIKTLIIHGTNPMYSSPLRDEFKAALDKVETVIYTGDRLDETGRISHWLIPDHHPMEGWGDAEAYKGVFSVQQPTIQPLYSTRGFEDSLMTWMKEMGKGSSVVKDSDSFYDFLRAQWKRSIFTKKTASGSFDDRWTQLLQDGVFVATDLNSSSSSRSFNVSSLKDNLPASKVAGDYELALYQTVGLRDGSLANVSWLQEFPDPVTKICWDNYACVSPATATKMKLKEGRVVQLKVGEVTVKVPVHVQPGQHDQVISLALGYGQKHAGKVAEEVGVDALVLAGTQADATSYAALPVSMKATEEVIELANTQGHHSMEGRQIVVEATLDQFKKNPAANIHKHKIFSLWDKHKYKGHKWHLSIDLSSCTGCSACVVACQSENNIPVVGKRYVLQGREMHWIRIDRYYVGDPKSPASVHMPVTCQHCDNAPCETVCPVIATVHSDEGTNDMIYNRCVGTRYCANNCPYKVRRFNWFSYTDVKSPLHMAMNPEVTVRHRGVMEKCTLCTHRIKDKKNELAFKKKKYQDGDIKTACQQSCPTNAITFGDINDPESAVSKEYKKGNGYGLLEEFNAAPAVRYLSKVRNSDHLKTDPKAHHGEGHH